MSNGLTAKCFVSYCHDDVSGEAINELVEKLRKKAKGEIIFYFDGDNQTGIDLKEFMSQINFCDSVVIVCSPKYKEKLRLDGENINFEFSLIMKKYEEFLKYRCDSTLYSQLPRDNFAVFPIIITDSENEKVSKSAAYPEELDELKIVYKRYTYISKKTRKEINTIKRLSGEKPSEREKKLIDLSKKMKSISEENRKIINRIVYKTLTIHLSRPIPFEDDKRISKLIDYTKAETNGNLGEVFCRTHFYDELVQQTKKVFVGRKGSGKSQTILQLIDEKKEEYKGVIRIDANNINIYALLQEINSPSTLKFNQGQISERFSDCFRFSIGTKKDISDLFSYEELLRYVWYGYIYLYCFYIIAMDDETGNLLECQKANFKNAKSFINKIVKKIPIDERWENKPEISASLYDYSFYKALSFFDEIIMNSRNEDLAQTFADIRAMDSLNQFLIYLTSSKALKSFRITLANCTRKIFLCLDGFDNIQQEQRGNKFYFDTHVDNELITKFETIWLTTLVDVIYQINSVAVNSEIRLLGNHLDMCLMVPFDRFVQASYQKRDGFVYRELMTSINYKAIDLCNVFTKRLQVITGMNILERQNSFEEILTAQNQVLNKFPNLCQSIDITLNNKQKVTFPLFLYLLRYSFWRPRDIIDHIRFVFKTVISGESLNFTIDQEMIVESLSMSTGTIVLKTIEEFKELWVNVKECLDKIKYKPIIMKYDEFDDFLCESAFVIELSNGTKHNKTREIIKFLYKLGFIGLILSNNNMRSIRSSYKQHQVFYSGNRALHNISEESFKDNLIFFNPVFRFPYNLIIDTNEVLGINTWDNLMNYNALLDDDL